MYPDVNRSEDKYVEGPQSVSATAADAEREVLRFGLRAKFIVTVLLILTVTMAANTWYFVHTSTQRQEQQLRERGHALGRLISLISPQAILAFDYLQLNDYTREVSAQPDVVYGVVVTPKGIPISTYIRGASAATRYRVQAAGPDELVATLQRLDGEDDLLNLEFPIVHNEVKLGRFLVGLSRESLHKEIRRQFVTQLLLLAAVVLFLGAAIYTVFRFNVLQPIQKLIAASRDVGRGEYAVVNVDSTDEFGMLARAFNAMASEVKHKQERLQRQANLDSLTGLPNRMMAFERISLEVQRAKRSGERFALMFIDLDNFKDVNDSLGHPAGDRLLVDIGARLKACMRDCDIVARLGGDEFLVVVPDFSDETEIEHIAGRISKSVSEPQLLCGRKVVAKCSIGVAIYPDNGASVEALMANADNAMYQAKAIQSGAAMFFTEDMNTRLRERVLLEQGLDGALEQGQLALFFQPIRGTEGGHHKGAEVLLRWDHPERGFISPADFIPVAEASGQIVQIGDWVLEQACRCWSAWKNAGIDPGSLAINISSVQFKKHVSEKLGRLMATYGIPPHALELELTERVLLEDHEQVAEEFTKLRALGVKLSLDDFGTGYSSLSYLKHFRFDLLKIDRSFVSGLPDNQDDASVIKAILAMAAGLDLEVVAEGVETQEQLQFLKAHACNYIQGYLLDRPMDERSYGEYLQAHSDGVTATTLRVVSEVKAWDTPST